jgi:hypothetical protein
MNRLPYALFQVERGQHDNASAAMSAAREVSVGKANVGGLRRDIHRDIATDKARLIDRVDTTVNWGYTWKDPAVRS